jgi:hypothetical protein
MRAVGKLPCPNRERDAVSGSRNSRRGATFKTAPTQLPSNTTFDRAPQQVRNFHEDVNRLCGCFAFAWTDSLAFFDLVGRKIDPRNRMPVPSVINLLKRNFRTCRNR